MIASVLMLMFMVEAERNLLEKLRKNKNINILSRFVNMILTGLMDMINTLQKNHLR